MIVMKLSLGIQSYCQRVIGVSNHLLSIVFRFHYHSQEVIGSLGYMNETIFWWGNFVGGTDEPRKIPWIGITAGLGSVEIGTKAHST